MGDFLDLAKTRRSVRTFDGKIVKESVIDELKAYADKIENPYGKKIRFAFLDAEGNNLSSPVLSGEKLYVTAMMEPGDHAEEAYGYTFESLLMKAHEMGLGTVWIGGTMPREKFEMASKLQNNEVMPCISPIGGIAKSMSIKEGLMRKGVKADKRFDFEKIFFQGDFSKSLSTGDAENIGLYRALEAVRIAPSAVNKQPWRVVVDGDRVYFYIRHDRGYDNGTYDLQKIDIGIAMYHFESQLISEEKSLTLDIGEPNVEIPRDTEYIASFRLQ